MWVWLALAVAVVSGAVWLVLLASDILGASFADVCLHGGAWPVLTDTRFGLVWCIRLALALLLALLLPWPATRWLQITIAAAFLALPALVGHAGATPGLAGTFISPRICCICSPRAPGSAACRPSPSSSGGRAAALDAAGTLCRAGGRSFLAARYLQRRNFAGERPRQQLEPAERATRPDSVGLWAPGGAQDRPVRERWSRSRPSTNST